MLDNTEQIMLDRMRRRAQCITLYYEQSLIPILFVLISLFRRSGRRMMSYQLEMV